MPRLFGLAVVATLVVAMVLLLRPGTAMPNQGPPEVPHSSETEHVLVEAEQWMADTAENGIGIVRVPVPGGGTVDEKVTPAPSLTHAAKESLRERLTRKRRTLARQVEESMNQTGGEPKDAGLWPAYREQLKLALKLERARILEELFAEGAFVTIREGDTPPPFPPGVGINQLGPLQMEDGSWGDALFFVDLGKRPSTSELAAGLREVEAHGRDQSIREFNMKPTEERKAWIEDYRRFSRLAEKGVSSLTAQDLVLYMAMEKQMQFLNVDLHDGSATMVPRY